MIQCRVDLEREKQKIDKDEWLLKGPTWVLQGIEYMESQWPQDEAPGRLYEPVLLLCVHLLCV